VVGSHIRHHPTFEGEGEGERDGEEPMENGVSNHSASRGRENGFDTTMLSEKTDLEPIPQDLLQKYIMYSKEKIPKLHNVDQEKMAKVYADIRTQSKVR
jgi:DNA replication licensing factor MCM2